MKKIVKVFVLTSILLTTNIYASLDVKPLVKKVVQPTTNSSTEWTWQNIINLPKDEFGSAVPTFDKQAKSYTLYRSLKSNNSLIDYRTYALSKESMIC